MLQTPLPAGDPASCVAGSWQVQDLTPIIMAAIPADILAANQITITGTQGMYRYDFLPDGSMRGAADHYTLLGTATRGPFNLDLTGELNGQGTGRYSVDAATGELVLTDLVDNGFSLDIRVAGISVVTLDSSQLNLWFGGASDARLFIDCSGSTLSVPLNVNGQNLPMVLSRINP